jgi:paraquat-inducible protein B
MNRLVENARSGARLPEAKIKQSRSSRLLWLVPIGAAGLCVWFAYRDFISTGPTIAIYFENADGLEAENTQLKYRGANVGAVKAITLTEDNQRVRVRAQLTGSARNLARAGSIFWIVRPELKVGAISGLRTIISGEYIAVQPGDGAQTNVFAGAEKEPVAEQPKALQFTLIAPNLGSLQEQTPIFYRGIQVGEVLGYQLANDARNVMIRARVREEYAPLVRLDSQFWNAGGLHVRGGLFKGIEVSAESLQTAVGGGIEFATPPTFQARAANGAVFVLNAKPEDKWQTWDPAITLHLPEQATQTKANKNILPR